MAAHATVEYVMPPLSSNCIATEKSFFLHGLFLDALGARVSEELVGELVRGLLQCICCEMLL
jgi:hypothetical protein